ncbi:MAG: ABC transporter ATP-binding protein/permease, partial [Rickettsiales bacterium]|nr:ABC transporter ATP-binding protein/permease [Rickettsiales bacterium]
MPAKPQSKSNQKIKQKNQSAEHKSLLVMDKQSVVFPKTVFRFYWQMLKKFWKVSLSIFVLYMIVDVLNGIMPALTVRWIIDGIDKADASSSLILQMLPIILLLSLCYFIMLTADILGELIRRYKIPFIGVKIHEILYRRISKMPVAFFKKNSAGFLNQQMNNISSNFTTVAIYNVNSILAVFIVLFVNITLLLRVHWSVVLIFSICAGYRFIHSIFLMGKLWQSAEKRAQTEAYINSTYVDSLSNFLNIKLFQQNNSENKYLNTIRERYIVDRQEEYRWRNHFWIAPYSLEQICKVVLAILLIRFYRIERMNLGDIAFALTSFMTMMNIVRNMVWQLPDIAGVMASASQAYKDIIKPIDIEEPSEATNLKKKRHMIEFKNISFRYTDTERWILKDMNLKIKEGESVGIVGLSGSGKSTLLYLLMRLYDTTSGTIKIDGDDIKNIRFDSLRNNISFVPQDSGMFNRTVAENISYGRPDATREEIIEAAKQAHAHDFILGMEKQYDSLVGERGLLISGGQRQRLAIARTICHDAPIIVM